MSKPSYRVFDDRAEEYDAWYERDPGKVVLALEVDCLRPFLQACPPPHLEIGVGSGRFASALGVGYGLDPAPEPLRIAKYRGIEVVRGVGERVPFRDNSFGGVLLAFTLCFVDDPLAVLLEARRLLLPGGALVLGLVPGDGAWADYYRQRGLEGHPIYSHARFYGKEEIESLLASSGFNLMSYRSTLLQRPGQDSYDFEIPQRGYRACAGFVTVTASQV